jgi:hypothetical protein
MAAKKKMVTKPPRGPHALTVAAERRETRAQEKAESPRFEQAERRLGLEKYDPSKKKKKR